MKGKITKTGYKKNSPDKNNDFNIIPSNRITMKNVPYPILGVSDTGHKQMMLPEQEYIFNGNTVIEYPMKKIKKGGKIKNAQFGTDILNPNATPVQLTQQADNNAFNLITGQVNPNITNAVDKVGIFDKIGGGLKKADSTLGMVGGITGALSLGTDLLQGASMLKAEKQQRKQAQQFSALSDITLEAASIKPEGPKRKYVRPEDQIIDPNILSKSYGSGTNFLAKNGKKVKKAQFGQQLGSFGSMAGSKIFGGTGEPSGAGKIGSTIGSTIGNILLPGVGGNLLGAVGGFVGGAFGAKGQKETEDYEKNTQSNLQNAAFQQGIQNTHNQYSGFMKNGGNMQMGGDLQTYWGGEAESVSQNPYLPEGGESVLFRGQSHEDGGIGVKFGRSKVEVEGGEPAVKLNNGGNTSSLTVFGDMKIPAYGASEIGDDKAKGKKFKSYINDLNKVESKQNKIVDNSFTLIDDANPKDMFDKLKISSGKAMLTGADMKLKDIAKKKQMASIVQNAILETAEEHGLKSDALAEGSFRKAKKGAKLKDYQEGGEVIPTFLKKSEKEQYLKANPDWREDPENNRLYKDYFTPGQRTSVDNSNMYLGSPEFQKAFGQARREGKSTFMFNGELKTTKLAQSKTYKDSPDTNETKYIPLQDDYLAPQEQSEIAPIENPSPNIKGLGVGSFLSAYMPFIRPNNKLAKPDLSPEMFALASNNLDPVQAQLYEPLLDNVSDISLQDQLNANQADFNSIQRQSGNNPAALASLAAQKYQANSGVLGEQFRLNQNQRMSTYNKNREILNDATLKNLGILDQQYVRQSTAKSNTKAIAQEALSSIADKMALAKRDQTILNIDQQRYNYRFGPKWNGLELKWSCSIQYTRNKSSNFR